jgi:hypothetical protein
MGYSVWSRVAIVVVIVFPQVKQNHYFSMQTRGLLIL